MLVIFLIMSILLAIIFNFIASKMMDMDFKKFLGFYFKNELFGIYFTFINLILIITFLIIISGTYNTFIKWNIGILFGEKILNRFLENKEMDIMVVGKINEDFWEGF